MTMPELESAIHAAHAGAPTDREILGEALAPEDIDADYLQGREYYAWLWAVARTIGPLYIREIGVRLGYSAVAMIQGAMGSCLLYEGWDAEVYIPGSNARAEAAIKALADRDPGLCCEAHLWKIDTQKSDRLMMTLYASSTDNPHHENDYETPNEKSIFFIDGDHTFAGALHDLTLAYDAMAPDGIILFDDVDLIPECRRAADVFIISHDLAWFHLPTFRGLYVMRRKAQISGNQSTIN